MAKVLFNLRLEAEQREIWRKAAASRGKSISEWARMTLDRQARADFKRKNVK